MKKIFQQLNFFGECRKLEVGLWSCPRFLFVIMGLVIMATILATYFVAARYAEPDVVIITASALTAFLLVIAQIIVGAFERVVYSRAREKQHAREVLELKDQFVSMAVHDLSTAATAIKWGLRTIEPKLAGFSPFEKEIFASIRTRNENLIELVREILLITRIESGHLPVTPIALSVRELVEKAVGDTARVTKDRGVEMQLGTISDTLSVTTDPAHLGEMLRILLNNAVVHADRKKGITELRVEEKEGKLFFHFVHNGIPIDAKHLEHVFEKFWRDEAGERIGGTGFGLYAVRELARELGGSVSATSTPERTEFILTLPKEKN